MLEIHVLELNKELTGQGEVENWIRFFNAKTEGDLEMIGTKNPGIAEAVRELRGMSMSRPLRQMYEAHMKRVHDERAREQYVRREGEVIGEIRGMVKGETQMAELITRLMTDERQEDALLAARDEEARKRFYREYGMTKALREEDRF